MFGMPPVNLPFQGGHRYPKSIYHLFSTDKQVPPLRPVKQSMHILKSLTNPPLSTNPPHAPSSDSWLADAGAKGNVALDLLSYGGLLGKSVCLPMSCDLPLPAPISPALSPRGLEGN